MLLFHSLQFRQNVPLITSNTQKTKTWIFLLKIYYMLPFVRLDQDNLNDLYRSNYYNFYEIAEFWQPTSIYFLMKYKQFIQNQTKEGQYAKRPQNNHVDTSDGNIHILF